MRKALLGLLTIGATIFTAHGNIIPTLSSAPSPDGTGNFTWNYSANVTVDQRVTTGDFFTIYDFGPIVAGSNVQPAGWTLSQSLTGPTPALVTPFDNAQQLNLTWTYTGNAIVGAQPLGNFIAVSALGNTTNGIFTAQGTRNGGMQDGSPIGNIGLVTTPFGGSPVPEMSALLPILSVCGAGFVAGIPAFLRRRKNS